MKQASSDECPPRDASHPLRRTIEKIVLLLVGLVFWRTWFLEGFPVFLEVSSGSMAPTLLGPHRRMVCGDCGYPMLCGGETANADYRAVCPNCGYAENDIRRWPMASGDRVLVHRGMYWLRGPRRWEVVALRSPQPPHKLAVKRVVGLPGEAVQIRNGKLYVDGALARKTLDEQRATGILVHDASYVPRRLPAPPRRWRPDEKESCWNFADGAFIYSGNAKQSRVDWLTYHHARRVAGEPGKVEEGPVLNEVLCNQGRPQRAAMLHPVVDLRLEFRLARCSGEGELWLRATDGHEDFRVLLDLQNRRYEVFAQWPPAGKIGRRPHAGQCRGASDHRFTGRPTTDGRLQSTTGDRLPLSAGEGLSPAVVATVCHRRSRSICKYHRRKALSRFRLVANRDGSTKGRRTGFKNSRGRRILCYGG